jgi:hypothetical protein
MANYLGIPWAVFPLIRAMPSLFSPLIAGKAKRAQDLGFFFWAFRVIALLLRNDCNQNISKPKHLNPL